MLIHNNKNEDKKTPRWKSLEVCFENVIISDVTDVKPDVTQVSF